MPRPDCAGLEQRIGYRFQDKKYAEIALTHSSYANELKKGVENNERQEFLGDAVLSIIVSDYLFRGEYMSEGELTKLRAMLVCEKSLSEFAKEIDLGGCLMLGKGEEHTGGSSRPSMLADAFEAVIAAVYLDGGIEKAREFVLPFVQRMLCSDAVSSNQDYKTLLQEIVQQNPGEALRYVLVDESGPDHDKRFEVEVCLNSNVIGRGVGSSKKSAEQRAAREALALMGQ